MVEDFPDVMEQIVVLSTSAPLPNDNISFAPDFPEDKRQAIVDALLALNDTEEGLEMFNTLYSWEGVEPIEDTFYDAFRQQLEAAGVTVDYVDS